MLGTNASTSTLIILYHVYRHIERNRLFEQMRNASTITIGTEKHATEQIVRSFVRSGTKLEAIMHLTSAAAYA